MRDENAHSRQNHFPDLDGVWNFDDFLQTELNLKARLAQPPSGVPTPEALELTTQLARAQGLQGKTDEAAATLEQVKIHLSKAQPRVEVRYLLEQGRIYALRRTPVQAQAYFVQAWTLAQQINETFLSIDAALMLAMTLSQKSQSEWLKRALDLAESGGDEQGRLWLPQIYMMRGWNSADLHRFDEALDNFNRALTHYAESSQLMSRQKMMIARWSIARTLRSMGRFDEAVQMQMELLKDPDLAPRSKGYVFLEIAEGYQLMRKPEAQQFFVQAYELLSKDQWYIDNNAHELSRIKHIGKVK